MVVLPNGESNHGSHANKIIQARLPEGHGLVKKSQPLRVSTEPLRQMLFPHKP